MYVVGIKYLYIIKYIIMFIKKKVKMVFIILIIVLEY